MTIGDITATTTDYATMALLNTALGALNTSGAKAGDDVITHHITPGANGECFYLTTIERSAA